VTRIRQQILNIMLVSKTLFNNKDQTGEFTQENEHSLWFGYGKVNAEAALLKSKNEISNDA